MASHSKPPHAGAVLAAILLSAGAWWYGTGLAPLPWLAWLAPLPLLMIAPRLRWHHAALAALCAGAGGAFNLWHYMRHIIGLPVPVGLLAVVAPGVTFALCLLLHRRLWQANQPLAAALAFPALWVTLDFAASLLSPHGTFGSLAYTQMDVLPVIQLASVTGIWGIVFVMLLAPSALAIAVMPDAAPQRRLMLGAGGMLVLAATFMFGMIRLQQPASGSARIGLASLAGPLRPPLATSEGQALLARYLVAIDALAAEGAQTIVMPETAFAHDGMAIAALSASAARHHVVIGTGVAVKDTAQDQRNMVLAFMPGAAEPLSYAKRHLIPGFEDRYRAGSGTAMLTGSSVGLAVCKDMDFHDIGAAYARLGANMLLVPAWDFGADAWLHSRMAVMRGVESGFAVARAARQGNLTLSDSRGRVVAEANDAQGDAQLVGDMPLFHTFTWYGRWGDWFAWACIALLSCVGARQVLQPSRVGAAKAMQLQ